MPRFPEEILCSAAITWDLENMFQHMEESHKQDMADLQSSLQGFHDCMEAVEKVIMPLLSGHSELQSTVLHHNLKLKSLWSHVDDLED